MKTFKINKHNGVIFLLLLVAFCGSAISTVGQIYDVRSLGAVGNGVTDNTVIIQKAIDACAETGGKVYFPKGTYLTGTLVLKSNVTLFVSGGATLLGSKDIGKYPYLDGGLHFYGEDWARQSLIFARDAENISIEGTGTIDGQGGSFKITTIKKPDRYKNRPYLLWFVNCRGISVRDIYLRNSAFWMQHYLGCQDVSIDHIRIWNHSNKNNDMLDLDGCRNVTVSNIIGDSDDDGLTLKSTSPLVSEYITITNCILSSHCNAIKFGTESTGGFRNVVISNCTIRPSGQKETIYGRPAGTSGISLEVADGGILENVTISNLVIEGPQVPVFIRLGNRGRKYKHDAPEPGTGRIRNIRISNIIATGADSTGCSITGIPGFPVEDISLSHILIEFDGGGTAPDQFKSVPEAEKDYPEATMFGKLPAYGLYIRHAKNIRLTDITFRYKGKEQRPGIVVDGTAGFSFSGLDLQTDSLSNAAVYVNKSQYGFITGSDHHWPAMYFLQEDTTSERIDVMNCVAGRVRKLIGKD